MSCTRVRRELLEIVRFGELGPGSAAHLEHLAGCRQCRDEVGFDRALVAQLRRALSARIDPLTPPPRAWSAILLEAQRPEPRSSIWTWPALFVGRLRTATAMAGTGLALLLALNMEVVPVSAPVDQAPPSRQSNEVSLQQIPRLPTGRTALVALANLANPLGTGSPLRPDAEQRLMEADTRVALRPRIVGSEPTHEAPTTELRLLVRPLQTPEQEPIDAPGGPSSVPDTNDSDAETVNLEPGAPS